MDARHLIRVADAEELGQRARLEPHSLQHGTHAAIEQQMALTGEHGGQIGVRHLQLRTVSRLVGGSMRPQPGQAVHVIERCRLRHDALPSREGRFMPHQYTRPDAARGERPALSQPGDGKAPTAAPVGGSPAHGSDRRSPGAQRDRLVPSQARRRDGGRRGGVLRQPRGDRVDWTTIDGPEGGRTPLFRRTAARPVGEAQFCKVPGGFSG